ncbi:hypothetical protein D3C72_1527510 [compost metagenome]
MGEVKPSRCSSSSLFWVLSLSRARVCIWPGSASHSAFPLRVLPASFISSPLRASWLTPGTSSPFSSPSGRVPKRQSTQLKLSQGMASMMALSCRASGSGLRSDPLPDQ